MPSWKKVIISGSNAALNSLTVTNGITGSLFGTASWAVSSSNSQNAQDLLLYVKNVSGVQIDKGKVVRISGATGDNALISTASYENDGLSANTLGIVNQNIPNDSFGYIITEGTFIGLDTSTPGWTAGQLLYLGANGTITGSAPQAPLHAVRLGQVLRVQAINGSMYVRIDNGYELGELHDVVDNTTTSSFGDLLVKSGSVWINSKQLTGSYGLTGSLQATSFTGSFSGSHFGPLTGTASYATQALSASFSSTSSFLNSTTNAFIQNGNSFGTTAVLGTNDNQSLALETSGSTRMFLSSSGDVGVGTTTPGARLHVFATNSGASSVYNGTLIVEQASGTSIQILSANTQTPSLRFGDPENGLIGRLEYSHVDNSMRMVTNAGEKMRITSAGDVGIGTTTPGGRLHVVGTSPSIFVDTSNTFAVSIGAASASPNVVAIGTSGTGLPQIQGYITGFGATTSLILQPNGGNVGVGTTTTPFSRLTTLGALSTTTSQMSIVNSEGGHTILRTGIASISNSGFSLISADVDGTNQNTRLVISSAGNVGIGTTTPNSGSLHVNGNVFATSYTGSLFGTASWANNATTATNANNVAVTDTTTGTGPYYLMFGDGTTGNRAVRVDSSTLTFNATTNTLTVPNLAGTASWATNASKVLVSTNAENVGFKVPFAATNVSTTGTYDLQQDSETTFTYNPSTNTLTVPNLAGTASWATNATTASFVTTAQTASYVLNAQSSSVANAVRISDNNTTSTPQYVGFVGAQSGTSTLFTDVDLTYIPSTNTLNTTSSRAVSSSFASTASFVNTLNQAVLITGSLTAGATSLGASENTITLGARDTGGEGGQLGFNAPGGTYTSASMLDNYQNRFRLLRGTNAGSDAEVAWWSMHNKQMALPAYNSVSAFSGTATALLAVDTSGNVITVATGSGGGGSGTVTQVNTAGTVNGITLTGGPITTTGTITLGGTLSGIANSQLTNSSLMIGNSSISLGATASSLTGLTSVTATSFTGSLQGTSSWANNATNAVNVGVTDNPSSGGGPFYIPFVASSTGNAAIQVDSSTLLYAPSTNTITVTNLAGTASWATNVTTAQTASFVTGSNVFGPFGSNSIRSASFAVSSSYAEAARTVGITLQDTTPVTYNVTFTGGTSGNNTLAVDSTTLTYNPSTSTFTTPIVNSTTAVQGGNGSVSAPAFSFSGDTDTGMYNAGANIIGFAQGGQAMAIMSASGFHMNSSGTKTFEIGAGSAGDTNLVFSPNTTGGTGGNINVNHPSLPLIFKLNSTERARITTAGNVGIGTTSPDQPLAFADSLGTKIQFNGSNLNGYQIGLASAVNSGDAMFKFTAGETSAGEFGFYNTTNLRMLINNAGNVGIGTSSPGNKLQISNTDSSNQLLRLGVQYNSIRDLRGGINWHDGANTTGQISTEYDGSMVSMVFGSLYNSGYNSNTLMTLRGNGNLGIGTASPSQTLHVVGSARITGAVYDSSNSAGTSGQVLSSTGTGTSWITSGGGSAFPYTGSALITGSLGITGSLSTTGSDAFINGVRVGRGKGNIITNTAVGTGSLSSNTTGYSNVAVGANTLTAGTTGAANTAIGEGALKSNTGNGNTAIGRYAGFDNTSGNVNILIGVGLNYKPDATTFNGSYALSIGKNSADIEGYPHIWAPDTVTIGNTANDTILTIDPSSYSGFFLEYVFDDTNGLMRSGTLKGIFTSGMSSIQWAEVDTLSIGNSSGATFSVVDNGSSKVDIKLNNNTGGTLFCNFTSRLILRQL